MVKDVDIGIRDHKCRRSAREKMSVEVFGIFYFILFVIIGGVLVWQPARVAEMNEELAALDASLKELKLQSEALRRTVSAMESLEYVEEAALTRLGMVPPDEVRTVAVHEHAPDEWASGEVETADSAKSGILSLFGRIAQIFGVREATAKGR